MAALQRGGIDSLQRNTSAGDKLILEGSTTSHLIRVISQDVDQPVDVLFVQFCPAHLSSSAQRFVQQERPQALRKSERTEGGQLFLGLSRSRLVEQCLHVNL